MEKNKTIRNDSLLLTTLDDLVPRNHLVRKLEEAIHWSNIYHLCDNLYSEQGRSRVDPIVLFKIIILNIIHGYNSYTKTCQEIEVNIAYRWFLGISLDELVLDRTIVLNNHHRKYKEQGMGIDIVTPILMKLDKQKLISISKILKREQYFIETKTDNKEIKIKR